MESNKQCRLCNMESDVDCALDIFKLKPTDIEPFYMRMNRCLPIKINYENDKGSDFICKTCYSSVLRTEAFFNQIKNKSQLPQKTCSMENNKKSDSKVGNSDLNSLLKRKSGRPAGIGDRTPSDVKNVLNIEITSDPSCYFQNDRPKRNLTKISYRYQNSVRGKEFEKVLSGSGVSYEENVIFDENLVVENDKVNYITVERLKTTDKSFETGTTNFGTENSIGDKIFASEVDESFVVNNAKVNKPNMKRGRPRLLKYICHICDKRFYQKGRLAYHISLHKGVRYECLECSNRFKLKQELLNHQSLTSHKGCGLVEGIDDERCSDVAERCVCFYCNKTYLNKHTLDVHLNEKHNENKKYYCTICEKRFGMESSLKLHMQNHKRTQQQTQKRNCPHCGKTCNSGTALMYHMETSHGDLTKRFLCNLCGKGFKHRLLLDRHHVVHSNLRKFKCQLCDSTFKTKGNLKNHMVKHTGEKRFTCDLCGRHFSHRTSLNLHLRWHSGDKPYECSVCRKKFSQLGNMQEHVRTHSGLKPYSCTVCIRAFATQSQLKMHSRRHVMGSGSGKSCTICSKEFKDTEEWRLHLLNEHSLNQLYMCKQCGKMFTNHTALRKHSLSSEQCFGRSSSEVNIKCNDCNETFTDSIKLSKHRQLIHKINDITTDSDISLSEAQIIYISYQDPEDLSTIQLTKGDDNDDEQISAGLPVDSEILLEDAATGVIQIASNQGLVTAEGTRTLQLTCEDGRELHITLREEIDKNETNYTEKNNAVVASNVAEETALIGGIDLSSELTKPNSKNSTSCDESPAVVPTKAADNIQFRILGNDDIFS